MNTRKTLLVNLFAIVLLFASLTSHASDSHHGADHLTVYKSPSCGCCGKWITHMQREGFHLQSNDSQQMQAIKQQLGIRAEYQSCHTAVSDTGYVFEGHIPAKFIARFLQDVPEHALGLSVPAMPVGTPGMEMGAGFMPYKILLLKKDGSSEVYANVASREEQL